MNNKSQLAGIFSIISGVFGILGGIGLFGFILLFRALLRLPSTNPPAPREAEFITRLFGLMYGGMGIVLVILGILGIIGGIKALNKSSWGMALTGAVCSILTFIPLGILATVFVAQAQQEFIAKKPSEEKPSSLS
jgi:hypothetical protein